MEKGHSIAMGVIGGSFFLPLMYPSFFSAVYVSSLMMRICFFLGGTFLAIAFYSIVSEMSSQHKYFLFFSFYSLFIAIRYGFLVGIHISLLALSFFFFCTPLMSLAIAFLSFSNKPLTNFFFQFFGGLLVGLSIVNGISMVYAQTMYLRTFFSAMLLRFFLLDHIGYALVGGAAVLFGLHGSVHFLISDSSPWVKRILHNALAVFAVMLFYFFFKGEPFERFVVSLNLSTINY